MLVTKRELFIKDQISPTKRKKKLASISKTREPVERDTGVKDYTDFSELMQSIDRIGPLSEKTKLTKGVVHDFKTYISRGLGLREVCALAGVKWSTFIKWRYSYPLFDEFIEKCLAEYEVEALDRIREAAKGGVWQADCWTLERKYPDRYGKRDVLKQEIYWKHIEFVKIVLEVINDADPALKTEIVNKLRVRKIDIGDK